MTKLLALVGPVLLCASTGPAHADGAVRDTAVTIEPIYLVLPMLDVTFEHRVAPHVGLSGTLGYGKLLLGQATLWEVAGAANVYRRRRASGVHAGVELRYLGGGLSRAFDADGSSHGHERIAGAYVGYKWVASYGLTAVLQGGVGRIDFSGGEEMPESRLIPVANFTAG